MTLTIATLAASIVLRWAIPAPGNCMLLSTTDQLTYTVRASIRATNACHASWTLRATKPHEVFLLQFTPDGLTDH